MGVLIEQLPALGVGASLSLSSKPDPVALVSSAGGSGFVEYAGLVDVDAHECAILDETWQMFDAMLPELPNIKAVCYECEGVNENTVLMTLKKIRQIVKKKSASQSLLNHLEADA